MIETTYPTVTRAVDVAACHCGRVEKLHTVPGFAPMCWEHALALIAALNAAMAEHEYDRFHEGRGGY